MKVCCANCIHFNLENGYCEIQQDWIGEQYNTKCSFWKQNLDVDE